MRDNNRVAFHTLGCKLNFSESSTLASQFEKEGFERCSDRDSADIHVINTCSVTDNSDKKCRNIIRKLVKRDPESLIIVTGCYAQLKAEEIAAIEGVDLVIGNNFKNDIVRLTTELVAKNRAKIVSCELSKLTSFFAACSTGDRTRTFLKVQDGCNYECSYCTIPMARGKSRNISIEEIVLQATEIAAKGTKEIVLTGVNIGDFGRTTSESFLDLIKALDKIEGIERYRISSIEPNLLTEEIVDFCAHSKKFMPHFHIPLQAGSDKTLARMRRRYTTSMFRDKIELVRSRFADVFIGIDVIVGFSGESEEQFEECYSFLKELNPSFLHVFPYSVRANTAAVDFEGVVSPADKDIRAKRLGDLSDTLHRSFCDSYVGTVQKVLFESTRKGGKMFGHSENYIVVEVPYQRELLKTIVDVRILEINSDGVAIGEVV